MAKINKISFSDFLRNKKRISESKENNENGENKFIIHIDGKSVDIEVYKDGELFGNMSGSLKKRNGNLSFETDWFESKDIENLYDERYEEIEELVINKAEKMVSESKEETSNNEEETKEKTDSEILAELLENKTFISKKEEDTQLMNKLLDILIDPSVKDGVKQLALDKCKEYLELTFEDSDIDESYFKIKESFKNKIWESVVAENEEEPKECYILLGDILYNIMNDGVEFKEIENLCNKIKNSEYYSEEIKCELCNKLIEFNENWFTDLNKADIDCNNILLLAE